MPYITPAMLGKVQQDASAVRNVCILAHVDHGKTTLSDSLIATNQIISSRLVGEVRYMDSTPEEQARGITMKASAISLLHGFMPKEADKPQPHLINLIDSPGHLDFAQEVSTAVRNCDGALVLVDVLEGVSKQTHGVLEQAWREQLTPILVFNKIDRLILELKLDPMEAYEHMRQLLEQVNVITGTLFVSDLLSKYDSAAANSSDGASGGTTAAGDSPNDDDIWADADDKDLYFSPERGNVLFASAIDGWAFSLEHFVELYAAKMGASRKALSRTLWGPYYYHPKKKTILKHDDAKGKLKPLFVSLVLSNIWSVYTASVVAPDPDKIDKIVASLKLRIPARVLRSKDRRILAKTMMAQWLPLAPAILDKVVTVLPSPRTAQALRFPMLLPTLASPEPPAHLDAAVGTAVAACDPLAPVTLAFVSKMVAFAADTLPAPEQVISTAYRDKRQREKDGDAAASASADGGAPDASDDVDPGIPLPDDFDEADAAAARAAAAASSSAASAPAQSRSPDDTIFVAFTRVFAGTLSVGDTVYVLGPKYDPRRPDEHVASITITTLFLMMGRSLEYAQSVPAGNVCGIGGLEDVVFNTATLSTSLAVPSFTAMQQQVAPIVRVAVEPRNPANLAKVKDGLRILNQADPCAQVLVQANGEHVLLAAGELHLQKCLKDLRERFAKCAVWASDPIVPYRETVVSLVDDANVDSRAATDVAPEARARAAAAVAAADAGLAHPIMALATPSNETSRSSAATSLAPSDSDGAASSSAPDAPAPADDVDGDIDTTAAGRLGRGLAWAFHLGPTAPVVAALSADKTCAVFVSAAPMPGSLVGAIDAARDALKDAMGTSASAAQDAVRETGLAPAFEAAGWGHLVDAVAALGPSRVGPNVLLNGLAAATDAELVDELMSSMATGFQLATSAGPLCAEPLMGVAFEVVGLLRIAGAEVNSAAAANYGPLAGQMMSAMKSAAGEALLAQSPRLMEAMYKCEVQANADSLGKLYALLFQRRGKVLNESMREGTPYFVIEALLPVSESFGLADRIQRSTTGVAAPQLAFASFATNPLDPFWVPRTEDELEEYGATTNEPNKVFALMNAVRSRKGLEIFEKLVEHADKQRTHKRNK
ncbi:uncharacterized protein AMSG_10207 [Thecamonas trahens ATCC 50062]|uniref:Ribosome assembly protein 1 n=1 Tax=Thecamonas trahens ATCC 50062 TaxID=461836 RepID=A0A0L0DRU4_THETB|nr:hypothetical protein AMSG_10207 [Thecamonas trahens ATCC 50062]KNC54962.1 hypothetical protein AMSG_10207 [Thecamonas trahens ATCC 50062]|eukprot:XP_013753409.1 hypothetical protein AMSG_10207 [Thecamonas trahens ATCC 50062]